MSRPCHSEVNFTNLKMQKSYYEPVQTYHQGYYGATNGYYENAGSGYNMSNMGSTHGQDYRGSCIMQGNMPMGTPGDYTQMYNQQCMQGMEGGMRLQMAPPSPVGAPSGHCYPPGQDPKGQDVFPWMKENRQNSKQKHVSPSTGKI